MVNPQSLDTWVVDLHGNDMINKFKYLVGQGIPSKECKTILNDLLLQENEFGLTDEFGDIGISVYEIPYNKIKDCEGKRLMDQRISEKEKSLGLKYNEDKFVIKYKEDRLEMKPHYDGFTETTLLYLNTDFEGGSTNFPLAKLEHHPQQFGPGHYIHYSSKHLLSFHSGMPVTKGTKTVIVLRSAGKNKFWTRLVGIPWMFLCVLFLFVVQKFTKKNIRIN